MNIVRKGLEVLNVLKLVKNIKYPSYIPSHIQAASSRIRQKRLGCFLDMYPRSITVQHRQ